MLKGSATKEVIYQRRLQQKDDEISIMQERIHSLSGQLAAALQAADQTQKQRRLQMLSPHAINVREVRTSTNKRAIQAQREKIGRTASVATRQVIDQLAAKNDDAPPAAIQRIMAMFREPSKHIDYLNSEVFANDLLKLANRLKALHEREPRVIFIQSPCYVFGDIHGNLEDLHFFSDNIWRLGMSLTAGNFLFLGDYVDRGMSCLECVAYLFAMKYQLNNKVFLLVRKLRLIFGNNKEIFTLTYDCFLLSTERKPRDSRREWMGRTLR